MGGDSTYRPLLEVEEVHPPTPRLTQTTFLTISVAVAIAFSCVWSYQHNAIPVASQPASYAAQDSEAMCSDDAFIISNGQLSIEDGSIDGSNVWSTGWKPTAMWSDCNGGGFIISSGNLRHVTEDNKGGINVWSAHWKPTAMRSDEHGGVFITSGGNEWHVTVDNKKGTHPLRTSIGSIHIGSIVKVKPHTSLSFSKTWPSGPYTDTTATIIAKAGTIGKVKFIESATDIEVAFDESDCVLTMSQTGSPGEAGFSSTVVLHAKLSQIELASELGFTAAFSALSLAAEQAA